CGVGFEGLAARLVVTAMRASWRNYLPNFASSAIPSDEADVSGVKVDLGAIGVQAYEDRCVGQGWATRGHSFGRGWASVGNHRAGGCSCTQRMTDVPSHAGNLSAHV